MRSTLNEERVRALFSSSSKECDVLIGLLKLAIPNWDDVEYILEGKPHIGEGGWRTIYDLFCDFNEIIQERACSQGASGLAWGFQ